MTGTAVSNKAARKSEMEEARAERAAVNALIAAKVSFLAPMTVIYFTSYIGLTALAGFAKGFMALKVIGAVNVGFILIACNYVLAWVLAIIYVHVANTTFDPIAKRAIAAMNGAEVSR
jgi:uncharacterized membrane protein (DUF485 family)